MEFLIVDGQVTTQVKGRELTEEELANAEYGNILIFRFHGNTFEEAFVLVRPSSGGEDDPIEYDLRWNTVDAA